MKKCPTCENTFEDRLSFCQADGTPLVTVEEEPPAEDPYKTVVANQSDLPIPPIDPFKTMVAGSQSFQESVPPEEVPEAVLDLQELPEEEPVDPMKTIVSTDFSSWQKEQVKPEIKEDAPPAAPPEEWKATDSNDISATAPEPPKFSEPDLNPPTFGDMSAKPAGPPSEPPSFEPPQIEPPPVETSYSSPFSSDPPPPTDVSSGFGQPPVAPPEEISSEPSEPRDAFGGSSFGKPDNVPIPSPFDDSKSSSYQPPSTPMPKYKEPESPVQTPPPSPFGQPEAANQSLQESGWNPPPAPDAGWPSPGAGQNTPFQPPPAGAASGPSQILAFVSLGLGILGLLILVPALLFPLCGTGSFLLGVGAAITGFLARSRAKQQPEQYGGAGLGLVGLILGVVSIIAPIAIFIFYLVLFTGLNIFGR